MPVLQLLETTSATTLEEFLADILTGAPDLAPEVFDNRPTWDNWKKN
ncbi:hypothetical protein [Actinomadura rupiterrae]|nr:hypothetical protein [Actinomadura rupiterrae]MCP2336442.1 hypothetical protein [Actinomadura rupiterrae]